VKNELRIGWVLILALGLVFGFLAWLKKTSIFHSGVQIYAWFPDVSGLSPGDPVSMEGRILGSLSGFQLPGSDSAGWIAILNFDELPRLKSDAQAFIKVREITGGRIIDIQPGTDSSPFSAQVMPGQTAWDIGTFLKEIKPLLVFFQDSALQDFIQNGNTLLRKSAKLNPEETLTQLDNVLKQTSLLLSQTNYLLSDSQVGVPILLKGMGGTLHQVQMVLDSLKPLLREASATDLQSTIQELREVLSQSGKFIHKMDSFLLTNVQDTSSLAGAVLNSPALKKELEQTLIQLRETLQQIQDGKLRAKIRL
jgi:ABC-type transporter Mla subunit MlaD